MQRDRDPLCGMYSPDHANFPAMKIQKPRLRFKRGQGGFTRGYRCYGLLPFQDFVEGRAGTVASDISQVVDGIAPQVVIVAGSGNL